MPQMLTIGDLCRAADAFSCHEFIDSEWLKVDVAIRCHTQEHDDARALAWCSIIIYPIGLLLVNTALLYAARKAILLGRPTTLSRTTAFLHREFKLHYYWWELVEAQAVEIEHEALSATLPLPLHRIHMPLSSGSPSCRLPS